MRNANDPARTGTALLVLLTVAACGDSTAEPSPTAPDPPRATRVTVTPATARLTALGESVRLAAEVLDQNGQTMAGAAVTWSSSATAVATTDENGLVTAAGNGTATITATAGSASGSAAVTVAQEVSAVTLTPAVDTLVVGDTLLLTAAATDENGHEVAGLAFVWVSEDTLVAVVDNAGVVTGIAAADVVVTATSSGMTGAAALTVVLPVPTTVGVTPDTVVFTAISQTAQLAAEVRDQIGRVVTDTPVSWASDDTLVADVDSAGLVTAAGSGTAASAARAGETGAEALVIVMQSTGSVVVSPAADTVALGDTLRLVAAALDGNGHAIEGAEFRWSSSDPGVAAVDDSGLVRGRAEGKATITAWSEDVQGTSEITVENTDRATLVAIYQATDGPNWRDNANWLTDKPLGEWYGVETDADGRVVVLDLSGSQDIHAPGQPIVRQGLSGSIPPDLGNLAKLRSLQFSYNNLRAGIPPALGNLPNLEVLRLNDNQLTGPIPFELGNLAKLETLDLARNDLSDPIPPSIGNLQDLTYLWLSLNDLSGQVPTELGNLAKLEILDLAHNDLSGPIPPSIGNLASLWRLALYNNSLTGPIPPELGNLGNLRQLWVRDNDFSASLPPELGDLGGLTSIDLRNNSLSGAIPDSFLQLNSLWSFEFGGNAGLCAPGTSAFANWIERIEHRDEGPYCNEADAAALELLYNGTNGAAWTASDGWLSDRAVEEWYGITADSLGRITALDLTRNGLTGRLPGELGNLAALTRLRIGDNALAGRLPATLSRLSLVELRYPDTKLCAPSEASFQTWLAGIPSHEGTGEECAPLTDREILEIFYDATGGPNWTNSDNWLSDTPLRDWFGVYADGERLEHLFLSGNNLSGRLPPELGNLGDLTVLWIAENDLGGPIPPELGDLTNLTQLHASVNSFTGPIPAELGDLSSLRWLNLFSNDLSGPIPPELQTIL
ncbi:MAG: hypothetical protein F4X11_10400 [Acidobacteria bacterium]|nr:hypothetical protein [Acidobacteriota bacterium]